MYYHFDLPFTGWVYCTTCCLPGRSWLDCFNASSSWC